MPITVIIPSGEIVNSQVNSNASIDRAKLAAEQRKENIPLELLRVHDAFQTSLPTTAASDDLGLIIGTFGTDAIVVQTSDSKNTSVTQRARFNYRLPVEYADGQPVSVVAWSGMKTTVANGTATVDFEVYKKNDSTGLVGSDLVSTAATTINSLTAADKAFVIDPTGLTAGDELDIRVTIAITDSATGTAVIGRIMKLYMLPTVRG
jgi:hypothetical protein